MKYPVSAALGVLCAVLCGCSARTDVSLTGSAPAQYSHVYVTAKELWFNVNGTAGPDDTGWQKFPLSTPTTVDLVADQGGTLGSLVTSLSLIAGNYSQLRLIPVDASDPLTASAQTLGAAFNAEADYVDSNGVTQQLRLELLNPDKGIGIPASLHVPVGSFGGGLGSATATSAALGTGTGDAMSTAGTVDATGGVTTAATTTSATTATTSTTSASFAISLDGTRDLVPFTYGTAANGILLSAHPSAYDLSQVGGISGTLTLTGLTNSTTLNSLPNIQADAEVLSADGSRHVVVLSTPVHADGTFLLYPLPTSSSTAASYDVVIHGPDIATIIIKAVAVTLDSTTATTSTNTASATTNTTNTTNTTPTNTTGTTTSATIAPSVNAVSVGILTARAASSYSANVATGSGSPLPAGAVVGFYQTLGARSEVPYLIEAGPIDPFNQKFVAAVALSEGTIDSGTFVASGDNINLVSAAPREGAGKYLVAASAPSYADGKFGPTASPPASGTNPVTVTVPAVALAAGATQGSIVAEVTPATPGKYDHGQLLVSHEGQLVSQVALDAVLAQGGSVSVSVPAGTTTALYYVSVRAWNSSDPGGTLQRQWYPGALDLRATTSGATAVTVN